MRNAYASNHRLKLLVILIDMIFAMQSMLISELAFDSDILDIEL